MRVIATYGIKGGIGKTSAAANLAWLAAVDGKRTLLWDLDPQGAASFLFKVKPKIKGGLDRVTGAGDELAGLAKSTEIERLDVLPSDFSYRHFDLTLSDSKNPSRRLGRVLDPLQDEYDLVVLDCPPGITLLSESVIRAARLLVVPVPPAPLAVRTFDQLTGFLGELDHKPPRVLAFWSMVDRRKRLHRDTVDASHPGIDPIAVPNASAVEQMSVRQAPVVAFAATSEAAAAYKQLWARAQPLL